jgi:SnoaL-like domain
VSDERLIQEVLARYARAVDARDGEAVAELYEPEGRERLSYNRSGSAEPIAEFEGSEAIRHAVATILPAHPHLGWAHHTTFDPIIVVAGDTADLDAQFVVYSVQGDERPASGWPRGATGAKGESSPSRPATTTSSYGEPPMVGRSSTTTRSLTSRPPALP